MITDPDVEGYEPMAVIIDALAASARGEEADEEPVLIAATIVVAANMVSFGFPIESVTRQFEEQEHQFRFVWDRETQSVEVSVEWLDG